MVSIAYYRISSIPNRILIVNMGVVQITLWMCCRAKACDACHSPQNTEIRQELDGNSPNNGELGRLTDVFEGFCEGGLEDCFVQVSDKMLRQRSIGKEKIIIGKRVGLEYTDNVFPLSHRPVCAGTRNK